MHKTEGRVRNLFIVKPGTCILFPSYFSQDLCESIVVRGGMVTDQQLKELVWETTRLERFSELIQICWIRENRSVIYHPDSLMINETLSHLNPSESHRHFYDREASGTYNLDALTYVRSMHSQFTNVNVQFDTKEQLHWTKWNEKLMKRLEKTKNHFNAKEWTTNIFQYQHVIS